MSGTTKNLTSGGGDFYVIDKTAISENNEISFFLENRYKFSRTMNGMVHINYVSESAIVFRATNNGEIINEFYVPKYYINVVWIYSCSSFTVVIYAFINQLKRRIISNFLQL